jgi:hypothetical protein
MITRDPILEILLTEYEKLKSEQTQRIGFRDNLLYVTQTLFGGVLAFALSSPSNHYALLVIPWICVIMGWTYLVNDEKISAIGQYIRSTLDKNIRSTLDEIENKTTSIPDREALFGWETAHRKDERRKRRKIEQLIIDQITFVISGGVALLVFRVLSPVSTLGITLLCIIEGLFLLLLMIEIWLYADLPKRR